MLFLSVIIAFLTLGPLWFAAVLNEHDMHPMRRLAELMKRPALEVALVALVAVGLIHHGATKTNVECKIENVELGFAPMIATNFFGPDILHSTFYTLHSYTNSDWLAFGGYVDWFRVEDGAWCFRFGSNLVERVTVFSCGEISSAPFGASNRISLLGIPLSIVPAANWHLLNYQLPTTNYQLKSLFWHTATPSNTLLLTWENALVRRDTNLPVTVQAELFPDGAAAFRYDFSGVGDISALSNAETQIWRDGVLASNYQLSTTNYQQNCFFAAPVIAGTNALDEVQARIAGGNTNAYYCADVVVEKGPAKIRVEPMADETNRGLLGAYEIVAMPGETNRLPFLIGPKYTVSAEVAFESFELVPPPFVPLADDTGTVERLAFGEAFSATNVTDRLVEVQWPVEFALEEIDATPDATTYALRVTPDWLDGEVTWYGIADTNAPPMRGAPPMRSGGDSCSCGCLVRDGLDLIHSQICSCEHCFAEGECSYEGHSESISLDMKDSSSGGGGGNSSGGNGNTQPDPNLPSVSVSFDKNVVIFEDRYEDSPGVFVERRSTKTKLTVTAYGGEHGGMLNLVTPSGIVKSAGESTMPGFVPPFSTIEWQANYEGTDASPQPNGSTVQVYFSDFQTLQQIDSSASLTVVEVKIKAQNTALQNQCWQRHSYGVCEHVVLQHEPLAVPVVWCAPEGFTIGAATNSQYKLLVCPVLGGVRNVTSAIGDVDLNIPLSIVEPQAIFVTNVEAMVTNLPVGTAGHAGMKMDQYVAPLTVSFVHIAIEEVPNEGGSHSGYYDNPCKSNLWSHSYSTGAGKWVKVQGNHLIARDRAKCGSCPPPWSNGSLIWDVPFGWHSLTESGEAPPMGTQPQGTFATDVKSTMIITSSGMVFVLKLGHWTSRDIYNEIVLDGVVIQEGSQ